MRKSQMLPRGSGDAGANQGTATLRSTPRVATHPPQGGADGEARPRLRPIVVSPPVGESLATTPLAQAKVSSSPEGAAIRSAQTNGSPQPLEHAEMPERSGGDSGPELGETQTCCAAVSNPMSGQPDGSSDQACDATHEQPVATATPKRRKARAEASQKTAETHAASASLGAEKRGQPRGESGAKLAAAPIRVPPPLATTIADIVKLGSRRRFLIKAQVRETNALGAYIRTLAGWRRPPDDVSTEESRGARAFVEKANETARKRAAKLIKDIESGKPTDDALAEDSAMLILSSQQARSSYDSLRDNTEKEMKRIAKSLDVYPWVKAIAGFGDLGLAIIVAEAGDVGTYKSVAALWKRCGLAVINGERQRRHSDAELAGIHGYSPRRRAEIWTIADSMFKHQWAGANETTGAPPHPVGPYGEAYGRKKSDYMQRVVATTELPYGHAEKWTPKRADNAARRYMTKRLLRDLYGAWRATNVQANTTIGASPANNSDAAHVASGERAKVVMKPRSGAPSRTSSAAARTAAGAD